MNSVLIDRDYSCVEQTIKFVERCPSKLKEVMRWS